MGCAPIKIDLIPAAVPIRSAIGASVGLRFNATLPDGEPFELAPYAVAAPFNTRDGTAPPLDGWAVTVEGNSVLLNLLAADTVTLAPDYKTTTWHWDVWLTNTLAPERLLFAHGDLCLLTP